MLSDSSTNLNSNPSDVLDFSIELEKPSPCCCVPALLNNHTAAENVLHCTTTQKQKSNSSADLVRCQKHHTVVGKNAIIISHHIAIDVV